MMLSELLKRELPLIRQGYPAKIEGATEITISEYGS
jgi:hypothetical protein